MKPKIQTSKETYYQYKYCPVCQARCNLLCSHEKDVIVKYISTDTYQCSNIKCSFLFIETSIQNKLVGFVGKDNKNV